jgi:hypothetical protein
MGKSIIMQQKTAALCSKLWLLRGNALQTSSDNLSAERTADCVSFRHKFFMNHILFVKKYGQHLGLLQTKLFGFGVNFEVLCMLWRFVSGSYCP